MKFLIINNTLGSITYNILVRLSRLAISKNKISSKLWKKLWEESKKYFNSPIITKIHNHNVILNYGYTYPINSRIFPTLNNPLIELVHQCYIEKKARISIVDVGAAIGDSVLLIDANCPSIVENYYCFDGDPEFFGYLQRNLAYLENVYCKLTMLSSSPCEENELIKIHDGTASSKGNNKVEATTLDIALLEKNPSDIDLIKIDVDGLDGKVIEGSIRILNEFKPKLIFEWYPNLCAQTGNNWTNHFQILIQHGYTKYIWFNKYGKFSHFMNCFDINAINYLAELCLNKKDDDDWYYDIVALHEDSRISPISLAELSFASNRQSFY